jgi:hypothetical protein
MNARPLCAWAAAAVLLLGCTSREPLPWKLIALGNEPISAALDSGCAVVATVQEEGGTWPGILFPDSTPASRLARRSLLSLPVIACGDQMRLHPSALPLALRTELGWAHTDSITVSWQCATREDIAALGAAQVAQAPHPGATEALWHAALQRLIPGAETPPEQRYAKGDPVEIRIAAFRPDGRAIGDTVFLSVRSGDPDQVVPALQPLLARAGPGFRGTRWALSAAAFGSHAHPEWALAPHTPVQFVVEAARLN